MNVHSNKEKGKMVGGGGAVYLYKSKKDIYSTKKTKKLILNSV
jgi:hypothetical protein